MYSVFAQSLKMSNALKLSATKCRGILKPLIVASNMSSCVNIINCLCFNRQVLLANFSKLPAISVTSILGFGSAASSYKSIRKYSTVGLARASAQLKKKPFKKKNIPIDENSETFRISAFCMAEEFDLDNLTSTLEHDFSYKLSDFKEKCVDLNNVVHMNYLNGTQQEAKDVFVFGDGSVVLWNLNDKEISQVLNYLKRFHIDSFSERIVESENEYMPCVCSPESTKTQVKHGKVYLSTRENEILEKYAISNAMALSVHLGAYESLLEEYIESMLPVTEDLKIGSEIKITKKEVLKKMGQLFTLRHVINLSSDLLDTPDFYWDREELEKLYQITFNHFCITRRTKVMNERLNHCIELVELLSSQISDNHHIKLEWMIIVLIMVEVAFEIFHYVVAITA